MLTTSVVGYAQPEPPRIDRVLDSDSVLVAGSADVWHMRYLEADALENPWVEIEDPYGGRIHIPSKYYLAVASDLTAFVEGTMLRSVFFVRRPLLLPVAIVFFVGLITVVAFPIGMYRRQLRRESERRQHADEVRRRLTESQEAERLRLAQDLHDGPVQDLHALRMRLSLLARAPATAMLTRESFGEVVEEIQRVIRELRGVSEDLRPPALAPFGLAAALGAFADRFRSSHPSIQLSLDLDDDGQLFPARTRLVLFRIAQEAMNNAAKHGRPSHIAVTLKIGDDRVLLSVRDDGQGYRVPDDLRALGRDGHYGLLGMAERADSIGAVLHIESDPSGTQPTEVRAIVRSVAHQKALTATKASASMNRMD